MAARVFSLQLFDVCVGLEVCPDIISATEKNKQPKCNDNRYSTTYYCYYCYCYNYYCYYCYYYYY